ncbi:general secretion pathway protein GspB [Caldimonas brevitalea]|uniref:Type II secretion system protein GspB C-terminal domain-containing protein n=1 Tax=Caldimonas brevitalea TaxID=413882 RepID=A0A0G3BPK0_9BURK|nr:general secretion pathway protein GspB [Caldimonas brevitalea]AKJ31359.1 hypothetical protein AAW51_4668 [Caldimonas brevitalea]
MSYILDALRRADSERERGAVPSLHTMPAPAVVDDGDGDDDDTPRAKPWVWIAAGVSLGLLVPLAWQMFGRDDPPPSVALAPAPAAALPAAPPPALPPETAMTPAEPPSPPPLVDPAPARPATAPMHPAERHAAALEPPRAATKKGAPAETAAPAGENRTARPTPPPAKPASEGRIYAEHELPAEIRRDLPKVAVGGSIHSDNAADRILIINGGLYHEGDRLEPELTLDKIELKRAVLKFRGYRYAISY